MIFKILRVPKSAGKDPCTSKRTRGLGEFLAVSLLTLKFDARLVEESKSAKYLRSSLLQSILSEPSFCCFIPGTAEGQGLVGPRPHHFLAPPPPLFPLNN